MEQTQNDSTLRRPFLIATTDGDAVLSEHVVRITEGVEHHGRYHAYLLTDQGGGLHPKIEVVGSKDDVIRVFQDRGYGDVVVDFSEEASTLSKGP